MPRRTSTLRRFLDRRLWIALAVLGAVALAMFVRRKLWRWSPRVPPSERALTLAAMAARPKDHWPRGVGHVVLAWPGTRAEDKGYHEPGGSFSPGVGSFGVAIGAVDEAGKLTTGDTLDPAQIQQRLVFEDAPRSIPAIATTTPLYHAVWSTPRPGRFAVELRPAPRAREVVLLVRSVGPAGGPLRSVRFDGTKLWLNGRWTLSVRPEPTSLRLGEEPVVAQTDWPQSERRSEDGSRIADSPAGWAYARLGFPGGTRIEVQVDDSWPTPPMVVEWNRSEQTEVQVPDARFGESLAAQVAHLAMSLVRNETRPGEPTNYPLEWLRDGAYVTVSLARAGHVELARALSARFAERDFFGGFGPEGDNPAFALWALEEVSHASGRPELDRAIYPHAFRKAQFIERLLDAPHPVFALPLESPIVPSWRDNWHISDTLPLVAEPARSGLIAGRMDGQVPLLFINAINYLGLLRSARLAERAGDQVSAQRWRERAAGLRAAWQRAIHTPERLNDRTAISGMWPSFVAGADRGAFRQLLEQRQQGRSQGKPELAWPNLWSYFDVAEMHQWLSLGRPDDLWRSLEYYLAHPSSPGLYTWGEGTREDNSFGLWTNVRGWVNPGPVTPHYWTAAEMLLLQLEMLAYVDETDEARPRWVLGGGMRPAWIQQRLSARRVGTSRGRVDWEWSPERRTMTAVVTGAPAPVELGAAFPAGARVDVRFVSPAQPLSPGL